MTKNNVTIGDVYELLSKFREEVRQNYVTKGEFAPVRAIAYGIIGAASLAVLAALLGSVVIASF